MNAVCHRLGSKWNVFSLLEGAGWVTLWIVFSLLEGAEWVKQQRGIAIGEDSYFHTMGLVVTFWAGQGSMSVIACSQQSPRGSIMAEKVDD